MTSSSMRVFEVDSDGELCLIRDSQSRLSLHEKWYKKFIECVMSMQAES